jgi:predicted transcriptional regulator YdeE
MVNDMHLQPQPQLQRLDAFNVAGLTARTTNRDESDPQVARIGTLWERIYEKLPQRSDDMRLYGVYSAYETDAHGAFDVTTGVAVSDGPTAVRIEGGNYLVFSGQGEMPQMVLAVWQAIWQYFEAHPEIRRPSRATSRLTAGPTRSPSTSGSISTP